MKTHIRLHYADSLRDVPHFTDDPSELANVARSVVFDGEIEHAGDPLSSRDVADLEIAEICFSRFNRHDAPDQHPALDERGLRSLSVGDVVEIIGPDESRFLACASAGFVVIKPIFSPFDPVEQANQAVRLHGAKQPPHGPERA